MLFRERSGRSQRPRRDGEGAPACAESASLCAVVAPALECMAWAGGGASEPQMAILNVCQGSETKQVRVALWRLPTMLPSASEHGSAAVPTRPEQAEGRG